MCLLSIFRATKRMNGQDVFGTKISASHITNAQSTSAYSSSHFGATGYMGNITSQGRNRNLGTFPQSAHGTFMQTITGFCKS